VCACEDNAEREGGCGIFIKRSYYARRDDKTCMVMVIKRLSCERAITTKKKLAEFPPSLHKSLFLIK
jgi:hypothetical protein